LLALPLLPREEKAREEKYGEGHIGIENHSPHSFRSHFGTSTVKVLPNTQYPRGFLGRRRVHGNAFLFLPFWLFLLSTPFYALTYMPVSHLKLNSRSHTVSEVAAYVKAIRHN
jgi:hypothetical protein